MRGQAPSLTIGERVRYFRERRGLSRLQLAGLCGFANANSIRHWEDGSRALTNIDTIRTIAQKLHVSLGELLDDQDVSTAENGSVADAVPGIRAALVDWRSRFPRVDVETPLPLGQLAELTDNVWRDYQDSKYERMHKRLPELLAATGAAVRASRGAERRSAQRLAASAHQLSAVFLTKVGQADLALLAANRGLDLAYEADDAAAIAALYRSNGHTMMAVGDFEGAAALCEHAAIQLQPQLMRGDASGLDLSMWGMLWLVASLGAARSQDRAQATAFLSEANRAAGRLGADANWGYSAFGPSNVVIHQVAAEAEMGNPQRAIVLGEALDTTSLPTERRARHSFELARAKADTGDMSGAVVTLLETETFAAEQVRGHVIPREIVRQALRNAGTRRDVLDLAARMGVGTL
ncbi:helix-turn-helix domain-containing protein [Glycomyces sp. YM15]|uniref:helix-turn-helix domain-containing protein n=1 Tax=Glycomyces sp. YM15 TaxID=2800446 RepID=UPI001964E184|nr:helix-turn-helix transcriptional regulator [Glycomyces sp. YM15]